MLVISISVYICLAPSLHDCPGWDIAGPSGHLPGLAVASAPTKREQTLAPWPIRNGESSKGTHWILDSREHWFQVVFCSLFREGTGPLCLGTFGVWLWRGRGSLPIYKGPRKHLNLFAFLTPDLNKHECDASCLKGFVEGSFS